MLENTINGNTIKLLNDFDGTEVGKKLDPSGVDKIMVTITHKPLEKGKRYAIRVITRVKDLAGNPMSAEEKWSFTTTSPETT
jgi:Bacterial Ig-like domain